ncbi:MAG: hypothetical protein KGL90_14290 [Burkholderiales bacterium]|nr:hypothetical protein [Burkholderiales bacterium]
MLVLDKKRARLAWLVGGALVLAVGGAVYHFTRAPQGGPVAATAGHDGKSFDWAVAGAPRVAGSGALASADPERPSDIPPEEWKQLLDGLRDHPQREAELKRVVGYMRFKNDVERWTALKDQPDTAERAQVGRRVLEALPAHFANQEVTSGEALMLQAAIYADLVPDEAQRKPLLESARQALMQTQAQDPVMQEKLRHDEQQTLDYKRREAEILARFTAKQIDQAQFEKELAAARVAAFK